MVAFLTIKTVANLLICNNFFRTSLQRQEKMTTDAHTTLPHLEFVLSNRDEQITFKRLLYEISARSHSLICLQ